MNYQMKIFLSLAILFSAMSATFLCMSFVTSCRDQKFPDVITTQPKLK